MATGACYYRDMQLWRWPQVNEQGAGQFAGQQTIGVVADGLAG